MDTAGLLANGTLPIVGLYLGSEGLDCCESRFLDFYWVAALQRTKFLQAGENSADGGTQGAWSLPA